MTPVSFIPGTPAARRAAIMLDDRRRLPWRFLSRHIAIDGLTSFA